MAGRGPAPKADRVRAGTPARGEFISASGVGWQHGPVPAPPPGLLPASIDAWSTWMGAWFAAFWSPGDLPGLRLAIRLFDRVERGDYRRARPLRLLVDSYGITPKGQRERRWLAPATHPVTPPPSGKPARRETRKRPGSSGPPGWARIDPAPLPVWGGW